jgi:hypothetical protein
MKKNPPVSMLLVAIFTVIAAVLTGTVGGLILASYRYSDPAASGIAVKPASNEDFVQSISRKMSVTLNSAGSASYPWGPVRVYEGMDRSGRKVVVEIDSKMGYLTALETYGQYPQTDKIDNQIALSAAEEFVKEYASDVDLTGLTMSLSSPGIDTTIKAYRIMWEAVSSEGVHLPQKLIVYIDAENGQVSDYIRITIPVQIDLNPALSRNQAGERLREMLSDIEDWQELESSLMVLPAGEFAQDQKLVWVFEISINNPDYGSLLEVVLLDANTGDLIVQQNEY